jgi:hexokinase
VVSNRAAKLAAAGLAAAALRMDQKETVVAVDGSVLIF